MVKFGTYVILAYGVYYLLAIGYEILKAPATVKVKSSQDFTVHGGEDDETKVIDDIEYSQEGTRAMEKKKN